ncbi:hypothetical protein ACQP2C_05635 [Micromonospora zamorensis]|uniref:hypothetical protein n=1 Tax=Micromonospora zamorensis TaxID=709883 RepID=UPI003D97B6C5
MSTLPSDAVPPPGAVAPPPPEAVQPTAGASGPQGPSTATRRPATVIAAILLMVPAAVTWLVAGVAFLVAMARSEEDGKIFLIVLALLILMLCLLLVAMTVGGMVLAWRLADPSGLRTPAGFTLGLFVLTLVGLLVQGKLSFQPTMVTPLVVGALSGVALVLINTRSAREWFASNRR